MALFEKTTPPLNVRKIFLKLGDFFLIIPTLPSPFPGTESCPGVLPEKSSPFPLIVGATRGQKVPGRPLIWDTHTHTHTHTHTRERNFNGDLKNKLLNLMVFYKNQLLKKINYNKSHKAKAGHLL